jgi:hypothetical protein
LENNVSRSLEKFPQQQFKKSSFATTRPTPSSLERGPSEMTPALPNSDEQVRRDKNPSKKTRLLQLPDFSFKNNNLTI